MANPTQGPESITMKEGGLFTWKEIYISVWSHTLKVAVYLVQEMVDREKYPVYILYSCELEIFEFFVYIFDYVLYMDFV